MTTTEMIREILENGTEEQVTAMAKLLHDNGAGKEVVAMTKVIRDLKYGSEDQKRAIMGMTYDALRPACI